MDPAAYGQRVKMFYLSQALDKVYWGVCYCCWYAINYITCKTARTMYSETANSLK